MIYLHPCMHICIWNIIMSKQNLRKMRLRVTQPVNERDYIQVSVISRKKNYSISSTKGEIKDWGMKSLVCLGGRSYIAIQFCYLSQIFQFRLVFSKHCGFILMSQEIWVRCTRKQQASVGVNRVASHRSSCFCYSRTLESMYVFIRNQGPWKRKHAFSRW